MGPLNEVEPKAEDKVEEEDTMNSVLTFNFTVWTSMWSCWVGIRGTFS